MGPVSRIAAIVAARSRRRWPQNATVTTPAAERRPIPTAAAAVGPAAVQGFGLGIDAGGTMTRWAAANADGRIVADGSVESISGLQLGDAQGRAAVAAALRRIAAAAAPFGPVARCVAGVTGFESAQSPLLREIAARALGVAESAVRTMTDIELACRAAFAPGDGVVVYAGTGSIAAHIDVAGTMHRAGGRGAVIDDAGGGHWIARHALRSIWRAEDAEPGAWRRSALARRVFEQVGGSDWAQTRHWTYIGDGASRGGLGMLALAVAASAGDDPVALALLRQAGTELARLALALRQRVGALPLALAGRVFDLHPAVEAGLVAALPAGSAGAVSRLQSAAHHAAAAIAARGEPQ